MAKLAHAAGALVACDNTFATPLLQLPLSLGADVVMHSTTKYFGGHSDVQGGALVFARRVAEFLAGHARIAKVNWPGLADHPGHAIARAQMRDFGAMMSVEVDGGRDAALRFAGRLTLFANATSLGGCESLIEHRASVEGPHPVSPQNLLRLSIGLEHADDLIEDLAQALA